jgi:hypothetical protein
MILELILPSSKPRRGDMLQPKPMTPFQGSQINPIDFYNLYTPSELFDKANLLITVH